MTTASKLASALLSSFLLAGTAGAAEPVATQPQSCKNEKDLTPAERRQIARGNPVAVCPATHNADGSAIENGKTETQKPRSFSAPVLNPAPKR